MGTSFLKSLSWLGVIIVAGLGVYLIYDFQSELEKSREHAIKAINETEVLPVNEWSELQKQAQDTDNFTTSDVKLQPGKPLKIPEKKEPEPIKEEVIVKPEVLTLQELEEEAQELVNQRFTLKRVFKSSNSMSMGSMVLITVRSISKDFTFYDGQNLNLLTDPYHFQIEKDKRKILSENAIDAEITVTYNSVILALTTPELQQKLLKVPADQRPETGRIKALLKIEEDSVSDNHALLFGKALDMPKKSENEDVMPLPLPPVGVAESQSNQRDPAWKETQVLSDGSVQVGWEDMNEDVFNELANLAKTYIDADGKPAGIQVSDGLKDKNSLAYRSGARAGDVIKSINGQAVRNMSEVRAVVSKQRNEGVREFNVIYERNGVEQTKTFKVPEKK